MLLAKLGTADACPMETEMEIEEADRIEVVLADDATRDLLATPAPGRESEATPPFVLAAFMILMIAVPIGAAAIHDRRRRMRRAKREAVSMLFAEDALRIVLRGHRVAALVTAIMTAGGASVLGTRPMSTEWVVFVLPALALVVFVAQMMFDHAALRYLALDGATAERRGPWLIVGGRHGDLEIRLSTSIFDSARGASVPAASAGLRRGD